MKFATTTALLVAIFAAAAQATCTIGLTSSDPNCCWGGDQGSDACFRQQGGSGCGVGAEDGNFCRNMGIPNSRCSADCCDTRTGNGKPCPKGKNRCDPESRCPF